MVPRKAIFGLIALLAATGCNAGTSGGLKRQEPPVAKETISKARAIAQHNKNAATIQSLRATPSIIFAAEDEHGKKNQGKLSGRMAMEREKDFRLEISSTLHKQADIGSNSKGFWFWVRDNPDKAIYTCDYEHVNASPLAVTMQPDWIIEAMGLREISERESETISASKGEKPGQLILTQFRKDSRGGPLTKVTVVDESSGEILEHRLYSGAKEKLLARATISQTQHIQMEPTEEDPKGSIVSFPAKIQLEWIVEKFSLDITMQGSSTTINPEFPKEQKIALFTEPRISGAVRTDLAKLAGAPASASSRIYESAPRSGIRLGNPETETFGVEGASNSVPLTADLASLPELPASYVGPQVPRAPEPEAIQAISGPGMARGTFR